MPAPDRIASAAKARIQAAQGLIQHTAKEVANKTPLRAEVDKNRAINRVAAVVEVSKNTAAKIVDYQEPASLGLLGDQLARAESLQGNTVDYLGVAWLDAGRIASNSVARIVHRNGAVIGTGFLVSNRLLLTNNHVIGSAAAAGNMLLEFRYELRLGESAPSVIRFELNPSAFFQTDERDDLDFTLVSVGSPVSGTVSAGGSATLADFGCCPLGASLEKHSVGELVNLIQHPDGDLKQIVVRENRIVHRGEKVLHYFADTEGGASGSPVFNDQWQVVALHHWGGPHREVQAGGVPLRTDVNEGIRVSAIITEMQSRTAGLTDNQVQMMREAFNAPPVHEFGTRVVNMPGSGFQTIQSQPIPPLLPGGGIRPPLVVSAASNEAGGGPPANRIDRHYSNRRGYNERFLRHFPLPMPQLTIAQQADAARVSSSGNSGNPFELKYEHFSVVLNAARRMAFYSICNIDGGKRIRVNRDTGLAVGEPEATETWATDRRVPEDAQLSDAFYARVRTDLRIPSDFFARGHLTRREDPNWGTATAAERSNNDTFHHPNACPQVNNAFNASQRAWQGIENFVLNSADDSNLKVTVITGPVFRDDDPEYDDAEFGIVQFPRQFWKIIARVEDGTPLVFAILADQSEVMDRMFTAFRERNEAAFNWPHNLSTEYKSTVAEIAELTGLDFGNLIDHDVFAAEGGNPESREVIGSPQVFFSSTNRSPNSFGKFASMGDFLTSWEAKQEADQAAEVLAEAKGAKKPPRPTPLARKRRVVEVEAAVGRVFADDLSGAKHQQFTVVPTKLLNSDKAVKAEVSAAINHKTEARIAVRFGDSRGLYDRIPGIRTNVELHIQGEWIPADEAFAVGGERLPVLHFTHDPLGFICTAVKCYS